jgi:translocation and assembly module TamB
VDWGRRLARIFCVLFAVIGALPLGAALLLRSSFVHQIAATKTEALAKSFGINARYQVDLRLWPLSLALRDVQVEASDGGSPFAVVRLVRVRPRLFALFAGKLMLDQIDVEEPRLRVVLKDGQLANLALKLPKSDPKDEPSKPFHAPFAVASISGGLVDLTVDEAHGTVGDLDLDVTAEDVRVSGGIASSFEVALHAERGALETPTLNSAASAPGRHTDVLCSLDARARIEPSSILVRHLELLGAADLTADDGAAAACDEDPAAAGRVEIALSHFLARLPVNGGKPQLAGHARVRAPIALGSRFASTPPLEGWAGADVDVRFADDTPIPEISGHLEGKNIVFGKFHLLEGLDVDVTEAKDKVTIPKARIDIASGVANLTDVVLDLKAMRLVHAAVDCHDVSFAALMRELGNSQHPHVEWGLRDVRVADLSGPLVPMKLDGDVVARTEGFVVYDAPVDEPTHQRVIGVTSALVNMHLHITDEALQFQTIHVVTPHSVLDATMVSLGYDEDLLVDVPHAQVGLEDITPLSTTAIGGHALVSVKLVGKFGSPELTGEGHIDDFSLGDIPFGNVLEVHAQLENVRTLILTNVRAQKNKSLYEMPSAKLDFGGSAGLDMDAEARSSAFGLRDFLSLFHMEDDPRFASFDADMAPRARIHLALGGPEDVCGAGFIDVRAQVHAQKVALYGETFDDGDVDLEYRSYDQPAGLAGVDVDVRSMTLNRLHPAGQPAIGQILGSASIHRGGLLRGTITVDGMPLSRLAALKSFGGRLEGAASGVLDIGGNVSSPELRADLDVTPIRARRATFGPSHLHLFARQADSSDIAGYTPVCHLPIGRPYDKVAAAQAPLLGKAVLDGQLFGGQIELTKVTLSSQLTTAPGHVADPEVSGAIAFRHLDLGALLDATRRAPEEEAPADADADASQRAAAPQDRATGKLSGMLIVEQLPLDDPGQMRARFAPTELSLKASGGTLSLRTGGSSPALLVVEHDKVQLPPMTFDLAATGGFNGSFTVKGQVDALTHGGQLGLVAELAPIDLSLLSGLIPKVDRAAGQLGGQVRATGSFAAPNVDGKITLHNGDFTISGLPSAISDVELVVSADTRAVKIDRATAHFAGGDLTASGRIPLKGLAFGDGEIHVDAKSVHLSPAEGISATIDANLAVGFSAASAFTGNKTLPRVTGDLLVTGFEYSRPVNLLSDVGGLSVHRKPQTVKTYDPSQDALTLDVRVRSKVPLRIKNNLAELELAIGAPGGSSELQITGTNQRIGLRGELRALPGGHFRLFANEFEIRQSAIRFDDPTRIAPNVDVTAFTEYRRYTDSSTATGSSSTDSPGAISSTGSGRAGGASWRITVHAYGDPDDLKVDMTSDPPLSQDDIFLLLTIGLTRSEVDQAQGSSIGASLAFEAVGTATGADRAVKTVVPVIDDFRFGSAYSTKTYRSEPQVTVGKAITKNIRASVTAGLAEDEELRSDIEFRLSRQFSVIASYDNINDVSSASIGNVGADFRWRLEFE